MKTTLKLMCITSVVFVLSDNPLWAHHGSAAHFDNAVSINETGIITKFVFTNPHSYIYFDVVNDAGVTEEWRCESSASTGMKRNGWTAETLKPGMKIEMTGDKGRREPRLCYATKMIVDGLEYNARTEPPNAQKVVYDLTDEMVAELGTPLTNGQPNISGYWVEAPRARPGGPPGGDAAGMGGPAGGAMGARDADGRPEPKLTAAGQAKADAYDDRFDNPTIQCEPTNILNNWGHDYHVNEIHQTNDAVLITNGYMDMKRTVHLNMDRHPENLEHSIAGHSIGKWEDAVLVIDTVGLSERLYDGRMGFLYSDETHIVERVYYDQNSKQLVRDYVLTDTLFFEEPITGSNRQNFSAEPYEAYGCVNLGGANNERPDGASISPAAGTGASTADLQINAESIASKLWIFILGILAVFGAIVYFMRKSKSK